MRLVFEKARYMKVGGKEKGNCQKESFEKGL